MWFFALAHAAETFEGFRFYVGDPHVHTGLSHDGGSADLHDCSNDCGDFAAVFDTARANGLDWLVMADHVNGSPASSVNEFRYGLAAALAADDPESGLVVVPGAEVFFLAGVDHPLGHKTLLLFGDNRQLATLQERDVQPTGGVTDVIADCAAIAPWMGALTARFGPALLIPHHPAMSRPMPTDWSCHYDAYEPAVEVYSQHGNSLDLDPSWDVGWAGVSESGTVTAALAPDRYGLRLGFMAGTDSHDTRPGSVCGLDGQHPEMPYGGGLTLAVADEPDPFDRTALRDIIIARHTWATTGTTIPAVVEYRAGEAMVGGVGDPLDVGVDAALSVEVRVPAEWTDAVVAVDAVGDAREWGMTRSENGWSVPIEPGERPVYVYVRITVDGALLYGEAGCTDGGGDALEYEWSSPSWLLAAADDTGGEPVVAEDTASPGDPTGAEPMPPSEAEVPAYGRVMSAGPDPAESPGCAAVVAPAWLGLLAAAFVTRRGPPR